MRLLNQMRWRVRLAINILKGNATMYRVEVHGGVRGTWESNLMAVECRFFGVMPRPWIDINSIYNQPDIEYE